MKKVTITEETKNFCKYLVDGGVIAPVLLTNNGALKEVQNIIQNTEEAKEEPNSTIQLILSEYENWCEINKIEHGSK